MKNDASRSDRILGLRAALSRPGRRFADAAESKETLERAFLGKLNKKERKLKCDPNVMAAGYIEALGRILAMESSLAFLEEDQSGWPKLKWSWRYFALSIMVRYSTWVALKRALADGGHDGAMVVAASVALGERSVTRQLLRAFPAIWEIPDSQNLPYTGLHPMILSLAARWSDVRLSLPPDATPFGPYQILVDCCDDAARIQETLRWMCDDRLMHFHVNREWFLPGLALVTDFPAEILSVYRVRDDLGISTPRIAHPVLEPPFDDYPKGSIPRVEDELFDRALAWARSTFPNLADIEL